MHTAAPAPTDPSPAAPRERRLPLWRPLWLRVVLVLVGLIGLTTAALFFGVDHFVSLRFKSVHEERLLRLVAQTRQTVDRELAQMAAIAALLVNDIDLINSAYYHLHLEGGREHPQAAAERIAKGFKIEAVSLWDSRDHRVATAGTRVSPLPLVFPLSAGGAPVRAEVRWVNGDVWVVAAATLHHKENVLARIQLARPLSVLFGAAMTPAGDEAVRLATGVEPPPGAVRVVINDAAEPPVAVDVTAPDPVALALADVKRILALVMAVFGVVLVVGLALFLRRLFRPVLDLIEAALAVGRGDFGRKVSGGSSEVAGLVAAFNEMSAGLTRLRQLERQVQHQEQLSAIGRVAARVAHDLNNPLTVISSVAGLVARRRDADPQLADDMRLILHHCERSIVTIEALLAYGRPIRLRRQEFDLGATCADIARRWGQRAAEVALQVDIPATPVMVSADPYQLEEMLDNLLDNARSVGRRVELAVGARDGRACVRVTDDGPGFSPEAREHLFEPFFTTRTGGTGLGLASCLAIARAHGGDIEVEPGPPAAVTVWLPAAEPAVQA